MNSVLEKAKLETAPTPPRLRVAPLLIRLVQVPEDNECLYHCLRQTCFEKSETLESIRRLCAYLMQTSKTFSEYLSWNSDKKVELVDRIAEELKPKTWGGYEELALISELKDIEFVIIDAQCNAVLDRVRMPDSAKYTKRVYLYYCGVSKSARQGKASPSGQEVRMVHYNYFANAKTGIGLFSESLDSDAAVLDGIAQCVGRPTKRPLFFPPQPAIPISTSTSTNTTSTSISSSSSTLSSSSRTTPTPAPTTEKSSAPLSVAFSSLVVSASGGGSESSASTSPLIATQAPPKSFGRDSLDISGPVIIYRCPCCGICTEYRWPPPPFSQALSAQGGSSRATPGGETYFGGF